jgi:hypothetical protein
MVSSSPIGASQVLFDGICAQKLIVPCIVVSGQVRPLQRTQYIIERIKSLPSTRVYDGPAAAKEESPKANGGNQARIG